MSGDDERLPAVLDRTKLRLATLQLRHQLLVVPLDLKDKVANVLLKHIFVTLHPVLDDTEKCHS